MNEITMTLQADHLILEALKEDIHRRAGRLLDDPDKPQVIFPKGGERFQ